MFNVATFINYPTYSFWITCCCFYISTCCTWKLPSLLKHRKPIIYWLQTSAASSPLSAFRELKRFRIFPEIRLWLKRMLWLVCSFMYRLLQLSPYQQQAVSFSYHARFTGVALLIQELVFCIHNLANCQHKKPSFRPVSAFDVPSSLSLIISNF